MSELEKLKNWLLTFPGMKESTLHVDSLPHIPGSVGLFCQGVEQLRESQDILGNRQVLCRCRFVLRRVSSQPSEEAARWALALQSWVREQSARGLAPRFGCEVAREQLRAEKGRLEKTSQTGTDTLQVVLTAEFMKKYEV